MDAKRSTVKGVPVSWVVRPPEASRWGSCKTSNRCLTAQSATRWWPAPLMDWNIIVLTIDRPEGATVVGDLSLSLSSPDHNRSAIPGDALYVATYRLDELFHRHGGLFRRAVYRVELLADSWRYMADFEYDPPPSPAGR